MLIMAAHVPGPRHAPHSLIFGATLLFGFGGYYVIRGLVQSESRKSIGALPAVFERVHAKELLVRDRSEDLQALWEHVHPQARRALQTLGVLAFPALKRAEIKRLNHTLETELPDLRAKLHREMMGGA